MSKTALGERLQGIREAARLSRAELAKKIGISSEAVRVAEVGTTTPKFDTLESWARACGRDFRIDFPVLESELVEEPEDVREIRIGIEELSNDERALVLGLVRAMRGGISPDWTRVLAQQIAMLETDASPAPESFLKRHLELAERRKMLQAQSARARQRLDALREDAGRLGMMHMMAQQQEAEAADRVRKDPTPDNIDYLVKARVGVERLGAELARARQAMEPVEVEVAHLLAEISMLARGPDLEDLHEEAERLLRQRGGDFGQYWDELRRLEQLQASASSRVEQFRVVALYEQFIAKIHGVP